MNDIKSNINEQTSSLEDDIKKLYQHLNIKLTDVISVADFKNRYHNSKGIIDGFIWECSYSGVKINGGEKIRWEYIVKRFKEYQFYLKMMQESGA